MIWRIHPDNTRGNTAEDVQQEMGTDAKKYNTDQTLCRRFTWYFIIIKITDMQCIWVHEYEAVYLLSVTLQEEAKY
jgi:hypothetical protein